MKVTCLFVVPDALQVLGPPSNVFFSLTNAYFMNGHT